MKRLFFAALTAMVVASSSGCGVESVQDRRFYAEAEMRQFLEAQYPGKVIGVSCSGVDSDMDSYVSCSGTVRSGDGEKAISAQCSVYDGAGCKPTQSILHQTDQTIQ